MLNTQIRPEGDLYPPVKTGGFKSPLLLPAFDKNMTTNNAPMSELQLYGSYSRLKPNGSKEDFKELCDRVLFAPESGLFAIGKFTKAEQQLIETELREKRAFGSARFLWCGGTDWLKKPENWYGVFNCTSRNLYEVQDFGILMSLGMQGCGTGAVIEPKYIEQLPIVKCKLDVEVVGSPGDCVLFTSEANCTTGDSTVVIDFNNTLIITVGDSRQGWVKAYQTLIETAMFCDYQQRKIQIDISGVRPMGTPIKGFGGTANPEKLTSMFYRVAEILNGAVKRKLTSVECCLLIDEPASCIQAGGVRRFAGIKQSSSDDKEFAIAKLGLWQQNAQGEWKIDSKKEALQASNHTRIFHHKPTLEECVNSVRLQWECGEGAIQWAGEAIARANADLLSKDRTKRSFLNLYPGQEAKALLAGLFWIKNGKTIEKKELAHRMSRYGLNPCFTGDMKLLTVDGYKRFDELADTKPLIINMEGEIVKSKVWCSGEKKTVFLRLTNGHFITCTEDHVLLTTEGEQKAANCKGKQLTPYLKKPEHNPEFIVLGFIQGDGVITKIDQAGNNGIYVNIGKGDQDIIGYFESEELEYVWHGTRHIYVDGIKQRLVQLGFCSKPLPERKLPESYFSWDKCKKAAFLNGLYSANGCVISCGRISFKTTCRQLADELKETFACDFGIEAYITTNKAKVVEFSNGVYQCRESYDINIQQYNSRLTFFNEINFSLNYRCQKLAATILNNAPVVRSVKPHKIEKVYDFTEPLTHWGVVEGFVVHNCAEKISSDGICNLATVALANIDPFDRKQQEDAFKAAALQAAALLQKGFDDERFQYSRDIDPIIIVSCTQMFDFFTRLFGVDWVEWWSLGRNDDYQKADYFRTKESAILQKWKNIVHLTAWDYCDRHNLKRPNRCTGLKPEGSLTLLTGIGCCGVHPPKSWRYIRRKEFRKDDPVALAAIDYGYNIKPLRGDRDENGNLLNDPWHSNCTGWVVEVPVEEPLVHLYPELEKYDPSRFSAKAQFDWFMQVQTYYCTHNLSSTLELRESEIEEVGELVYKAIQNNEGYVSMAMLGRFDNIQAFPRLPFEPISKEQYEQETEQVLTRRKSDDFNLLLSYYLNGVELSPNDAACDGTTCEMSGRDRF